MQKVIEAKESTNAQVLRRAGTKQIKRGGLAWPEHGTRLRRSDQHLQGAAAPRNTQQPVLCVRPLGLSMNGALALYIFVTHFCLKF